MNIKVTYPVKKITKDIRRLAIYWAKYPFVLAGVISLGINLIIKGPFWSGIVLWSLWTIWQFLFAPTLIENNRTSIAVKLSINITILITIIYLVYPSWPGLEVGAFVVAFGLITAAVLFFSNISRQKQNVWPLLIFIILSLIFSVLTLALRNHGTLYWAMIVAISVAVAIFIATAIVLRISLFSEIKKRFIV